LSVGSFSVVFLTSRFTFSRTVLFIELPYDCPIYKCSASVAG
jgi:hypothetical protein